MQYLLLATAVFAIIGAILTAYGRWEGFLIWMHTNTVLMIHNYLIGEWQQAILFLVYFFISLQGVINFRRLKN